MEQLAEAVNSLDYLATLELRDRQLGGRLFEVDAPVGAFVVIVRDELPQDAFGMAFTANKHPVQAFGPRCEHEPFGKSICFWRSEGCFDNFGAYRCHHLVKGPDELCIPVTDKEAERSSLVLPVGDQVPGLLGDPGPDGVSRYPG